MLAVRDADFGAELRVPSVAHHGALADMGRMNGDSPSEERAGSSRAATITGRALGTFSRSSLRHAFTASIPKATCETSSACSPTGPGTVTSNSLPSTGPEPELVSIPVSWPQRSVRSLSRRPFRCPRTSRRCRTDRPATEELSEFDSTHQICAPHDVLARRGPCSGYMSVVA
jgi:hypothetical protein